MPFPRIPPPARALPGLVQLTLCLLLLLSAACSKGKSRDDFLGDASFGSAPPEYDAASEVIPGSDPDNGQSNSDVVKLRVFHGVLNLAAVRFCYDPDYLADDPATTEDELDPGPEPPTPMFAELDGGVLSLGDGSDYFMAGQERTGAILAYRAALPVALGMDAGSGSNSNVFIADGGRGVDGGDLDAAIDPCDPANLEAVLPIPLTASWLEPPAPALDAGDASDAGMPMPGREPRADAGPTFVEGRGLVTTLAGEVPLTLFGSGRSLDPKKVAERRSIAQREHFDRHPGDDAGAEAAGRATQAWLESNFGPRFLLTRGSLPARPGAFALSLVHLIPDVVSTVDAGVPFDPQATSSGALHLCVGVDESVSDLSGRGANLQFRNATPFDLPFSPGAAYTFKLFVEADFKSLQTTCGMTGLLPVAELEVPKNTFQGGHSYTLVAWGARSPDDLCTVDPQDSVTRPGCARSPAALKASIVILENDLPEQD